MNLTQNPWYTGMSHEMYLSKFRNVKRVAGLATLFFSLSHMSSYGQQAQKYPEVNILSPNASSLGKYVDFPVNMHTGVPEVSIPIYTVKEGPLELPISLSYHAAGLKVQELASWVGAGWTLNAGGVVSRTVRGLPDDEVGYDNYSSWKDNGYSNFFATTDGMVSNPKTDYYSLNVGHKDGEPDLFFFNFSGYSGKFYFREDRTPVMIPKGDVKIEPYFKPGVSSFSVRDYLQGFVITVPNGTRYYFGVTTTNTTDVDPVEKSAYYRTNCSTGAWGTDKALSSWYLYRVESPDGKSKIELTYRQESYAYHLIEATPQLSTCENINVLKSRITGVALDKITFSNGSVTFIPSVLPREDLARNTGDLIESVNVDTKSLAEIKVESNSGALCTSFKLSQNYFTSSETLPPRILSFGYFTSDQKRLKLNSLQEFRCGSSVGKPAYIFQYYDESRVSRRLSFSQDHWGFNNGAIANNDLMPTIWNGTSVYSASFDDDREAHWPQMRAGTLRSIQYPTGGGTEYIYEPNRVVTSKCIFNNTNTVAFVVSAGMSDGLAGYGTAENRNFQDPVVYQYRIAASGNGSGKFFIDNTPIATVGTGETKEDYISLSAGTHVFRAYANTDTGSGNGVVVYFYQTTKTCVEDEKLVGGLRIKRIEQFGVKSTPQVVKSFKYDQANLYSIPVYVFKVKNELLKTGIQPSTSYDGGCVMSDGFIGTVSSPFRWAMVRVSPVSVHPMQTTQGNHIGYGKVTEILPDGGYTINEFKGLVSLPGGWQTLEDVCVRKFDGSTCNVSDPVYPLPPLSFDFGRGSLNSKTVFDKNNNKLSQTTFSEEYLEDEVGVFGVTIRNYPENSLVLPTHYELKSAKLLWQKQVNRVYNPSNATVFVETENTTEYNSPFHQQATKVSSTTSEGIEEERTTYIPDLTSCNVQCASCAVSFNSRLETLWNNYQINFELCPYASGRTSSNFQVIDLIVPPNPLEGFFQQPVRNATSVELKGSEDRYPTHPSCIDQPFRCESACKVLSWTNYQMELNELRRAYTSCMINCKANNNCLALGVSNPNPAVSVLYKLESKNQIASPVESSVWNGNQLLQSSYFDYQLISDPPLDINLKKIFTTELLTPTNTFTPVVVSGGNIVKDAKYSATPEASYEYDQGRIVEKTSRDGVKTSYIWGYNNAVPIVKAIGVDYVNLRTAYNANPDGIRSHALMVKAQITTYQHDPVIGILSITDPNGKSQSFDYDLLGRLLRIKDSNGKVIEQYEYQFQGN
jgi:YD repeat-containing protein